MAFNALQLAQSAFNSLKNAAQPVEQAVVNTAKPVIQAVAQDFTQPKTRAPIQTPIASAIAPPLTQAFKNSIPMLNSIGSTIGNQHLALPFLTVSPLKQPTLLQLSNVLSGGKPSVYSDILSGNIPRIPTTLNQIGTDFSNNMSLLGKPNLTPQQKQQAGDFISGMLPFAGVEETGANAAKGALKNLMQYGADLRYRGYSPQQIAKISLPEYKNIVANNIAPFEHPTFKQAVVQAVKQNKTPVVKPFTSLPPEQQQFSRGIADAIDTNNVKNKANIVDLLRTPSNVLKKLGMQQEALNLRNSYDTYKQELPKEIAKITEWSKRAPGENQQIFQWLDGNKKVTLSPQGLQVATEIKSYLKGWADKLNLPQDRQISDYITHIFNKGAVEKEIDPDVAKLIRSQVAKSVFDPFLQQRINKPGYLEDTWKALDAYTKRAVRKYYVDQGLKGISEKADQLPDESYSYVKSYIARVNMQPTTVDTWIDNAIKASPIGYKYGSRPVTQVAQTARQMVFRGLIGLNPGTALRNLQQSTNTYSVIGEKYFLTGAIKTIQNLPKFLSGADTELHQAGVLDNIVQDRTVSAIKGFWQKIDPTLFYLFDQAEKINRGIAYFGAKDKALAEGKTLEQAIQYGKDIVARTQFRYDAIDAPVGLSSDLAKTIFQFGNYPVKQAEFLAGLLKEKPISGSIRWLAGNLLFVATLGQLLGLKMKDSFPDFSRFAPDKFMPPVAQPFVGAFNGLMGTPDQYGNKPKGGPISRVLQNKDFGTGIRNYIPAGAQLKKTIDAQKAIKQGGSKTPSGKLRFQITHKNQARVFGIWSTPEGQAYLKKQGLQ